MKAFRTLGLAALIAFGGVEAASAGPMSIASGETLGTTQPSIEKVVLVCGPYRCWHRPGWGYRYGWYRPWGWGYRRWGWGYHPWGWHRWGWRRW